MLIYSNKLSAVWNTYSAFAHRFKALTDGRWSESARIGTENGRTLHCRLLRSEMGCAHFQCKLQTHQLVPIIKKKIFFILLQVKHNQNNHWQNDIFIKCSKKILDYSIVGILLTVIIDSNKLATIWNTYSAFAHRFKALADGRWTESARIGTENGGTLAYRLFSLFHAESECL